MHTSTFINQKAVHIPPAILCVIVVLVCIALIPPASAGVLASDSVTITAKIGDITLLSADFTSDVTEGMAPVLVSLQRFDPGQSKYMVMGLR